MKYNSFAKIALILIVTSLTLIAYGCGTSSKLASPENDDLGDFSSFTMEKSGAVLWGENCSRCHNAPDPTAFSDQQWDAIGQHMRIRAGLTADETKKIVTFLQQSN
tara:strand:+ start:217 stop:534 length:318 start_codon:yes stop_codon:yes gene_type:complete